MNAERNKTTWRRGTFAGHPQLTVHIANRTPSWKRYGDGAANIEFVAYSSGRLGVDASEFSYAFAPAGEKRDTAKRVMFELDRGAAVELHKLLGEMLGATSE